MKFNWTLLLVSALAAAFASCKGSDDETTFSDYMTGTLRFTENVNTFLERDEEIRLTPTGITDPETVGIYYYYTWNSDKDTTRVEGGTGDGSITVKIPHELGEYTITCIGYASGYYQSSVKATFQVVSPELNTTIKDAELTTDSYRDTDQRDGRQYYCTKEFPRWFKMNLAYSGSGLSYEDSPIMDMIFGKFYTWNEAQTACPEGWALPTDADFVELARKVNKDGDFKEHEDFLDVAGAFMVNALFNDTRMWEFWPQVKITNATGLCVMPTGYCTDMDGTARFAGLNDYAALWTADEEGDNGFYRYIYVENNNVMIGKGNKDSFRANVRCIRKQ
ncbi:MAG: FISUMP domain-containing protein [Candidatus Cryptobacteroides sp.]